MQSERQNEKLEAKVVDHQKVKIEILSILKVLETNYSNLQIIYNSVHLKLQSYEKNLGLVS